MLWLSVFNLMMPTVNARRMGEILRG
jgi:hypothetical protein